MMSAKSVLIWTDRQGNKWLGDGRRMYAADGSIPLNEDNVLAVLDVDKDKREKIRCQMGPTYDERLAIEPNEETDVRLRPIMSVYYADELITLMVSDDNQLFGVRQSAIRPVNAKYGLVFYLRRKEGSAPWVVCFEDMFATAVLLPEPARVVESIVQSMREVEATKIVNYEQDQK